MIDPQEQSVLDKPLWTVHLTEDEYKLLRRVRNAAETGQMLLVDPDSMTWHAVGKIENAKRPIA
jgi:hypothetical protein